MHQSPRSHQRQTNLRGKQQSFSDSPKAGAGSAAAPWQWGGRGWWIRRTWETTACLRSRWAEFAQETAPADGESHTVFLNPALLEAKRHSARKHAYIANVIPTHTHTHNPRAVPLFPASLCSPRCCQNNALPRNKISSWQPQREAACELHHRHMPWVVMVLIRDGKGGRKWVVSGALRNSQ